MRFSVGQGNRNLLLDENVPVGVVENGGFGNDLAEVRPHDLIAVFRNVIHQKLQPNALCRVIHRDVLAVHAGIDAGLERGARQLRALGVEQNTGHAAQKPPLLQALARNHAANLAEQRERDALASTYFVKRS